MKGFNMRTDSGLQTTMVKEAVKNTKEFATSTKGKITFAVIILVTSYKYRKKLLRSYIMIKNNLAEIWKEAKDEVASNNS